MLFPYHIPQWCMTPEIKVSGFIHKRKILALLNVLLLFLNKRPSKTYPLTLVIRVALSGSTHLILCGCLTH